MTSGFQVGGSVAADSSLYVRRQADTELYDALKNAELCYVFNSRQMGKSSLLVNVKSRLQAENYRCCFVDVSRIGSVGTSSEQFYGGLASELWRGFGLPPGKALMDWWKSHGDLPAPQKLGRLLTDHLLDTYPDEELIIFLDEIDSVRSLGFAADDLFLVIRACYNQRALDKRLRRLGFALFGVALPSDLISDSSRSPFNIGHAIRLEGFQLRETLPLEAGLPGDERNRHRLLERVLYWTRGQPFLTQKICSLIAMQADTGSAPDGEQRVDELIENQVLANWENNDNPEHLRTIKDRILSDADHCAQMLALYLQVLEAGETGLDIADIGDYSRLYLTGLIAVRDGRVTARTRIYETLFDRDWAQRQLNSLRPYSEKLRAWEESGQQDVKHLLSGADLEQAKDWASDKHLPEADHRYLAASRELENLRTREWNQRLQEEIDQRKKTEQELQLVMTQLEAAKSEADAANRAKSEFLARVSHEVRTHINGVLGLSYVAQQQEYGANNVDYLRKIHRAANYMLGVVNDIVDIDQVERGELALNQETFFLDDVLDKLVDVFGVGVVDKGLDLRFDLPNMLIPAIVGDPVRLEQLLSNLVANAIKYTDDGTIVIAVEIVASDDERRQIELRFGVRDSGPGVAGQSLKGKVARSGGGVLQPGIGLGICCELAPLMGGELRVDSVAGRGTEFSFNARFAEAGAEWLSRGRPLKIALAAEKKYHDLEHRLALLEHEVDLIGLDDGPAPDLSAYDVLIVDEAALKRQLALLNILEQHSGLRLIPLLSPGIATPHWLLVMDIQQRMDYPLSLKRMNRILSGEQAGATRAFPVGDRLESGGRVLVAEDDEINQQVIAELLRLWHFDIDIVANGAEAIEAVRTGSYQLVLMDIEMPVMGGVEAVKKIRELGRTKEFAQLKTLPIIAMTAHALTDDRKKFMSAGMNDHIGKPLEPNLLAQMIRQWMPGAAEGGGQSGAIIDDISIEQVDTQAGLQRCGGNLKLYLKILQQFADKYRNGLSFEGHDLASIATTCHTIKGSAANLGIATVSELAAQIEAACKNGDHPGAENLGQLSDALKTVAVSITGFTMDETAGARPARARGRDEVVDSLRKFIEALDRDHAEAAEIIAAIDVETDPLLKQIETKMTEFDTDSAKALSLDWIANNR